MKRAFFFFLICISFGCRNTQNTNLNLSIGDIGAADSLIVIDIDTLRTDAEVLMSSIFSSFEIIPLETASDCMIGSIIQLEVHRDTIYVLDSSVGKGLFLFDERGSFIRKIGNVGKGPGEYLQPASFAITSGSNKQILILDNHQNKILVYTLTGEFLRDISFQSNGLIPIQIAEIGNEIFIDQLATTHREVEYLLYAIDYNGSITKKYLDIDTYQYGFNQPFNLGMNFSKTPYDIKYTKPLFDTVFSISPDGKLKPFLTISTKNKISRSEIEKMNAATIDEMLSFYRDSRRFLGISNYLEDSNMLMFRFKNNISTYSLLYWPLNKQMLCINQLIDDLTFSKYSVRFYSTSEDNSFISCIQNNFSGEIQNIIDRVRNGTIQVEDDVKASIMQIDSNSNPLVVKFRTKAKMAL